MTPRKSDKEKEDAKLLRAKKAADDFISQAKEIHGDKYDYTNTEYKKSSEKVSIMCRIEGHGTFDVTPNNHVSKKSGCPPCAKIDLARRRKEEHIPLTCKTFIAQCEALFPGMLDFKNFAFIDEDTETIFTCMACHYEYLRIPTVMLKAGSHGCGVCVGGVKDSIETFLAKIRLKGFDKLYDYRQVVYINAITKIKLVCKKNGHEFEITPGHHLGGDGCRRCNGFYRTRSEFINLSQEKFGDGSFNYNDVIFVDMRTPVSLTCKYGHRFETTPGVHLSPGSLGGCKECQSIGISIRRSYTQDQWIELARKVHDDFYNYDNTVYSCSSEHVTIKCPIDGDFQQSPVSHLSGCGCPKCGIRKSAEAKVYTEADKEVILAELNKIHKGLYKYGKIFNDSSGKLYIQVICEKHDLFIQRLDHHKNEHGCKNCTMNYSKQEIEWLEYCMLREGYIQHAKNRGQYKISGTAMTADGFNEQTNTIYEFQGDYWHGNPKVHNEVEINTRTGTTFGFLYERTKNKINMLISKGYIVREMWESDWKRGKKAIIIIQRKFRNKDNN